MINLHIIWDFDAPIGQINSSYPYNFNFNTLIKELNNVEEILKIANEYNAKFTFAITGFTAEEGLTPYHQGNLIRKIFQQKHEIASHTWRHEWLPLASPKQIHKSLERSKSSLEKCIGLQGAVKGIVPPHSRPMSWYRKGAISLGDRGLYPFFKGGDLSHLIRVSEKTGYQWIRTSYRPIVEKILGIQDNLRRKWHKMGNITTVPLHYVGFDEKAVAFIKRGIELNKDVVLGAHPLMYSMKEKSESAVYFLQLLDFINTHKQKVRLIRVDQNPKIKT